MFGAKTSNIHFLISYDILFAFYFINCLFQYTLKESARIAGVWEEPPLLSEIPPKQMEKMFKHVSSFSRNLANTMLADLYYPSPYAHGY